MYNEYIHTYHKHVCKQKKTKKINIIVLPSTRQNKSKCLGIIVSSITGLGISNNTDTEHLIESDYLQTTLD